MVSPSSPLPRPTTKVGVALVLSNVNKVSDGIAPVPVTPYKVPSVANVIAAQPPMVPNPVLPTLVATPVAGFRVTNSRPDWPLTLRIAQSRQVVGSCAKPVAPVTVLPAKVMAMEPLVPPVKGLIVRRLESLGEQNTRVKCVLLPPPV